MRVVSAESHNSCRESKPPSSAVLLSKFPVGSTHVPRTLVLSELSKAAKTSLHEAWSPMMEEIEKTERLDKATRLILSHHPSIVDQRWPHISKLSQ
jgi:hypothetical protein